MKKNKLNTLKNFSLQPMAFSLFVLLPLLLSPLELSPRHFLKQRVAIAFSAAVTFATNSPFPPLEVRGGIEGGVTSATNYILRITSEELIEEKKNYLLKGGVKIEKVKIGGEPEEIIEKVLAREAVYNSESQEAELIDDVYYEDSSITIKARRAKLNLKDKTGVLYDAEIVFKKEYTRIITPEVEKLSENHFIFKKAIFTTCEGALPDWCIKGRDVDFIKGDRVSAKDATFNIKGIPVLYTPYIWAPAITERKTGFLIPSITYSNRLGAQIKQPFYIVLGEHSDSTIILDLYSERGIGKGLEFRTRGFPENFADLWAYHIRDTRLNKDFYELLIKQNLEPSLSTLSGDLLREFIYVHTVTDGFFNTYAPLREVRLTRFLNSSAEVSYLKSSLRLFASTEYYQDLSGDSSRVAQKLPEVGLSVYPDRLGPFYGSLELRAGNFLREEGTKGQRLWISPGIIHSTGEKIVLSQSLKINGASYWLEDSQDSKIEKQVGAISYTATINTSLRKDFHLDETTLIHTIEPSIRFIREERIGDEGNSLHGAIEEFFDIRDLFKRSSRIEMELLNRFLMFGGESNSAVDGEGRNEKKLLLRFTQPYDTLTSSWLPFVAEASFRTKVLNGALEAGYDQQKGLIETVTFKTGVRINRLSLNLGERYSRELDLLFLNSSVNYQLSQALALNSTIWYDLKGGGLRNFVAEASWKRQCWTLNLRYIKTPEDYSIHASIDLRGL
jgi:LPS-assembly protein